MSTLQNPPGRDRSQIKELHYLTIAEAARLIRAGTLSPVELTQACLGRIDSHDAKLHAFITVMRDSALRDAEEAESEIRQGRYRGALHGIPIAHKDIILTRGVRTTAHSRLLERWVPQEDATVFTRLRDAGAVCIGKSALHEFAFGSPGPDEAFPAARNPWNPDFAPGSSSSGSAVAVAAGMCLAATGTDTGGSVRHPASVCGILGMKPTYGLVSNHGVIPLAPSLDHVGPMTRTVEDNAIVLQAMAGFDPKDPCSVRRTVPHFSAALGRGLRGVKIGVPRRFMQSIAHDEQVLRAFGAAEQVLETAGAQLVSVEVAGLETANDIASTILVYEAFRYHKEELDRRPEQFGQTFRERIDKGRGVTPAVYEAARKKAAAIRAAYADVFQSGVRLLITPGRESPAETMTELFANPTKRGLTNRMYNLTGLPALTMPMGFSEHGLPMGIQLAADHWDEVLIYQAAFAYENATGWSKFHPPDSYS